MLNRYIKVLEKMPSAFWIFFFFVVFLIINFQDIAHELEPDELYSLKRFVFVPWSTVLTDYDVPNNHILFNVINKTFLQLCNISSLPQAIKNPGLVRSINIAYVFFSFIFLYHFACIFHGRLAAALSVLFFISTPAFLQVALVARGYMLSITLLSALLFFTARVFYRKEYWYSILVVLCTAHLGFTNPTNYLFIGGMIVFITAAALLHWPLGKRYFLCLGSIIAGILFSFILYASVFRQVFDGDYELVLPKASKNTFIIMCEALPHILTTCFFLVPLLLLPLFLGSPKKKYLKQLTTILLLFAAPFIINISLKHAAPPRVFAPSAISIAVLFGFTLAESIQGIAKKISARKEA